jgi:hypothetical protein
MFTFEKQGKIQRFTKNVLEFMKSQDIKTLEVLFKDVDNGATSEWKMLKISIEPRSES